MIFEVAGTTLPIRLPLLWGGLVGLVFSTVGAALAIAVSSVISIANYMRLGIELDMPLLLLLLAGTVIGAWVGPRLSEHFHERWLQGILGLVLLLIGIRYLGVY